MNFSLFFLVLATLFCFASLLRSSCFLLRFFSCFCVGPSLSCLYTQRGHKDKMQHVYYWNSQDRLTSCFSSARIAFG